MGNKRQEKKPEQRKTQDQIIHVSMYGIWYVVTSKNGAYSHTPMFYGYFILLHVNYQNLGFKLSFSSLPGLFTEHISDAS